MDYPLRFADQLRPHLRALRKQCGLTQAQLGQQLGLGQGRIAEIEARPGVVSVDQLFKILSVLGVTVFLREQHEVSTVEPARKAAGASTSSKSRKSTTSRAAGRKSPLS